MTAPHRVLTGVRVLLAGDRDASLADALRDQGATVVGARTPGSEQVLAVAAGEYDAVVLGPSVAASWVDQVRAEGVGEILEERSRDGRLVVAGPDDDPVGRLVDGLGHVPGIPTPAGVLRLRATAATLDHADLALSPNGLLVLRRLARRPGEVVTRELLLRELPGASRDPHAAEVAVARLREALGAHAEGARAVVRTVIKRGYRLAVL